METCIAMTPSPSYMHIDTKTSREWWLRAARTPHVSCVYIKIDAVCVKCYCSTHCIQSQSRPFGHLVSKLGGFSIDDNIFTGKVSRGACRGAKKKKWISLNWFAEMKHEIEVKYWKSVVSRQSGKKNVYSLFQNWRTDFPVELKCCDRSTF